MTDYTKTTNFAAKDSLASGNANKIVKGAEIDAEFSNIATAVATKSNIASPTFTGTVTGPTIVATTAFVPDASDGAALGTTSLEFSDLFLADGSIIYFGADQDTTITHVADTGLLINSTRQLQFGDSGTYIHQSADGVLDLVSDTEIEINATTIDMNGNLDLSGTLTMGSAAISEADIEQIDDLTAGTVTASKAVVVDSNKDIGSFRNITLTGELDAGSLDVSGDADIDGTLETDALSINGTTVTSTAAELNILDGVTSTAAELNILDGVTSTAAELNLLDGVTSTTAELNILDGVTASAADINLIDGITNGTVIASKAIITDSNKDITGGRNITISGELDAATLDISGDADIDGTLEADAITIAGVTLAETIADTVGAMVSSNTESGITVAYEDADNTLDFTVGTLNQDTTGTADNFTVSANNSTDETVYPVFVDGATGSQGAETDTGLTYNPSTGLLTSTGFSGNLTGTLQTAAQTNITSLGTLTALTGGTGDFNWDSNTLVVDSSANRVGILNAAPDVTLDIGSATDAVHVPVGTTAQRPTGAAGYFRYNSTTSKFEGYTDSWGSIGGGSGTNMDTNIFAGDGSDTTFTLSNAPDDEQNLMVFVDGVFQAHDAYSVSGTTLTFSAAPANGRVITVYHSTTTVGGSNNTINTMTGDNSDTTLTLSVAPVHENNVQVYFDGVYQSKSNYSISGTTLTFSTAPPTGVLVEAITNTNTSSTTANILLDADSDTKIQVEESSDEDKIRFDIAGTEKAVLESTGLTVNDGTIITVDDNSDVLTLKQTNADDNGVKLAFVKDSASPADADQIASISFYGDDDAGNANEFVSIKVVADDVSNGSEDGHLKFFTQGAGTLAERMRIDSSGNVGIGDTAPDNKLQISDSSVGTDATANDSNYIKLTNKDAGTQNEVWGLGFSTESSGTDYLGAYVHALGDYASNFNTSLVFGTRPTSSGAAAERMRIDSAGKVGIGTTSPAVNMHVHNGSGSAYSRVSEANNFVQMAATSSNLQINWSTGDDLKFEDSANNTMMQIDSAGHVTMPLQSAFLVRPSADQDNIAINGARTVEWATEIYDRNADFNATSGSVTINGASTAAYYGRVPVTGIYQFNLQVYLKNLDVTANYYELYLYTSNRTYYDIIDPGHFDNDLAYFSLGIDVAADMDANDTVYVAINQNSGAAQTDISAVSHFSGYLVA